MDFQLRMQYIQGMRVVLQRVRRASVTVDGLTVGEIDHGALVLLGAATGDTANAIDYLVEKITTLRFFEDRDGKMNLSLAEVSGALLIVSQFTLYGDTRKGRRPSFTGALEPVAAEKLYLEFVEKIRQRGIPTETGVFGAKMLVALENDGPVTFVIDSPAEDSPTEDAPAE